MPAAQKKGPRQVGQVHTKDMEETDGFKPQGFH